MTASAMPRSSRAADGANGFGFDFASSFTDVFDDLFGEFMGGRKARRQNRGADLRYNLEITLEEAFHGKNAQLRVNAAVACDGCGGTGAEAGTKPEQCPTCQGAGKMRAQQGFFTIERTCRIARVRPLRPQSLQSLPRLRPCAEGTHAVGHHSGRRRRRHAHPPVRAKARPD